MEDDEADIEELKRKLFESQRLNDLAERVLDDVLRRVMNNTAMMIVPRIDNAWSALKSAREQAGRNLPPQ
ncbi:MAG: hypothetical protein NTY04_03890 [Candidatus Staskawiczbacteria bacterium]|nr:hypothetical protein [Candidatus Staskawiczbacteria bacterium]